MHSKGIWPMQRLPLLLNILPESGMTDSSDTSLFAGQSGTASVISGNVGKSNVVKTEGICKNVLKIGNQALFH